MTKTSVRLDTVTVERCRRLITKTAEKHAIPPVMITAHIRSVVVDQARISVMRVMIRRFHMRRWQIALIMNRDVRRVRRSVLGI